MSMVIDSVTYTDSFGVKHILKEIKKILGKRTITANIYRIKANDSVKCRCFCIGFIDFMLKGKRLLDFTNLFCPTKYENNYKIMLKYINLS